MRARLKGCALRYLVSCNGLVYFVRRMSHNDPHGSVEVLVFLQPGHHDQILDLEHLFTNTKHSLEKYFRKNTFDTFVKSHLDKTSS